MPGAIKNIAKQKPRKARALRGFYLHSTQKAGRARCKPCGSFVALCRLAGQGREPERAEPLKTSLSVVWCVEWESVRLGRWSGASCLTMMNFLMPCGYGPRYGRF